MWFLNSLPEHVDFKIFVEGFGKSYQHTSLQFCVSSDNDDENEEETSEQKTHFMVMPFPYSVNKENGSFKIVQDDRFDKILEMSGIGTVETVETVNLTESDITVYKNVKQLKKSDDKRLLDIPTVREIWNIYIEEDYGVFVAEIKENVVYRIDYTHKISVLSSLFAQISYSNLHMLKNNSNFSTDIWVSNAKRVLIPKFLDSAEYNKSILENVKLEGSLDRYSVNKSYDWGLDVRFSTNCWESSDEDYSENEEDN